MHGIVNLMHAFLRSVCNVISYITQDDRGSRLLRQNKTKTSVFTTNSDNVSLRLFYNSLPLPRMWFVLVSNGWLDSRSNSTIRKSACAGEQHVFGIQTCAPSVFFRICYGIQPRIRKYGFVNLVTETLIS